MTLAHLPLNSLLSASLVSRAWKTFAFPHLYHTMSLAGDHDLEQLAHRVTSSSNPMLSVSAHIRVLCVGDKSDACIHVHDPYADGAIEKEHIEYLRDLGIILSTLSPAWSNLLGMCLVFVTKQRLFYCCRSAAPNSVR
jgi:hypothetical protein